MDSLGSYRNALIIIKCSSK